MDKQALYIGLMSGTSLDAIDAALVDFTNGIQLIDNIELDIPTDIRSEIIALNSPCSNELARSLVLDKKMAELFSEAVKQLLSKSGYTHNQIIAIGSHGQTLRHAPDNNYGYSLQVGDPNIISEQTGITVVSDFRSRDIAAGGQGAPLVPAFHKTAFVSSEENRAIINIGGMANISLLFSSDKNSGFDTGPGNILMDYWCQKITGQKFDENGAWAKTGQVNIPLLEQMFLEPYFKKAPPKSTGRELFDAHWLEQFTLSEISPEDVQATLLELTSQSICDNIPSTTDAIYLCGGGAFNEKLVQRITKLSNKATSTTEKLGISPEWVEAATFAWLAKQTINHQTGNAPEATGAKGKRILGGVYFNR